MGKRKTSAVAVAAAIAPAAGGTLIPAEHVTAVAKRAGVHDSVPAKVDHTARLVELSTLEVGAINRELGIVAERMSLWKEVGTLGSTDPQLFGRYADMVREKALLSTGLVVLQDGKLPSEKEWPDSLKVIYNRHISKRVAETRKCMAAMKDHYTRTMEVLSSDKGTYHQKLALLPNPTNRGRKPGTASTVNTGADVKGESATVAAIKSLKDLSSAQLVNVAQGIVQHGKQRAEYQAAAKDFGPAFMIFVNDLSSLVLKYENAVERGEAAPKAASK